MKKWSIFIVLVCLILLSLSFGETVPLLIQGKEVKGENLDGLVVYIQKIQKVEELPLYSDFKYLPEGVFYVINLFLWNKTQKEILITANNFNLIDDDGKSHPVSAFGSIYYTFKDYNTFLRNYLKPGELKEGYLVFEIHPSNVPYKLNIIDIPEKGKNYYISLNP
ncbi:DUF4352 domain-containing protein [Dictyoglomus thermophilum]|uniref:DUF4352 domain-containing protein n=1 Tax=Dictyoglomus thermophilum TaxID=14 RepID=A0A7C3PQF3_DICTH|nr:DUF4352 domain-containing protein [Dictyoglomus thermophilum]TYT23252.1 DUF4352 domain-containing protein [Dictyoglomus thermophilum]